MESKAEINHKILLDYATKMKVRGEKNSSIMGFLEQNTSDQELIKQIFSELSELKNDKPVQYTSKRKNTWTVLAIILLGAIVISTIILLVLTP